MLRFAVVIWCEATGLSVSGQNSMGKGRVSAEA